MTRLRQVAVLCMSPETTLDQSLDAILETAIEIAGVARGNLQLLDRDEAVLRIAVQRGFEEPFLAFFARVDAEDGAAGGAVMDSRGSVAVEDITRSAIFAGHPSLQVLLDAGVRSVVSTPMIGSSGEVLGVISAHGSEPHAFTPAIAAALEMLARQSADFLERARGEDRLRGDVRALEESEQRTREFLAVLGHELRSPLGPIRNSVRFLQSIQPSYPDLTHAVSRIDRQVVHMARLIDDVADFSRLGQDTLDVRIGRVQPFEVIEAAIELWIETIESRHQRLRIDVRRKGTPIAADRERLIQVLGNLLSNASKFTPEMGSIEIAAHADGDRFVFRVSDDGIGLPVDRLESIFQPFVQIDPENPPRGLGIGLSLTRRIVELHGGTIAARSPGVGQGSTFTVTLPLDAPGSEPVAEPARRELRHACRILIVDDDADSAESLALLLRAHDHDVRVSSGGVDALRAVSTFEPRVVLLDIGLPGMDGYEVARRLRALPAAAGTLFVAISGWAAPPGGDEPLFDALRTKPLDPDDLLQWIDARLAPGAKG